MSNLKDTKPEGALPERVRYVEVAPKSGWQTMAKTVRETDEERIRDTKEDIDTLLVFAGLFSAVLSAFLIESYQTLQPDPQQQIISLLQTIATQSYTYNAGMLNVTLPLQGPSTFEVPTWALCVNGLWFASLIVSLATASFGMLVKSWLREYLAVEQLAPQLRLRARQYRYPGLQKWKVFEIAAALPLLLQLALGLFFIGLCFFTAQINSSMSLTSLPLVAAWAFFFVLTTIAPTVSPRCPFKLFLLKRALKWARRWVRPTILYIRSMLSRCGDILSNVHQWAPVISFSVSLARFWSSIEFIPPVSKEYGEDEEDIVIASSQEDTEILSLTDEMILDDSLLNVMLEALQQSRPDPPAIINFVMRLISNRIPVQDGSLFSLGNLSTIPDLTALSRQAYITIMEMIAEALRMEPGPLSSSSPSWMKDAILLLMSSSSFPLPDAACLALGICLDDNRYDSPAGTELGRYMQESLNQPWSLQVISSKLISICNPHYLSNWSSLLQVYNALLETIAPVEHLLLQTMAKHDMFAGDLAAQQVLKSLWLPLIHIMKAESLAMNLAAFSSNECIYLTINLAHMFNQLDEFASIWGQWWLNKSAYRSLSYFAGLSPQNRIADHIAPSIMQSVFLNIPPEMCIEMIQSTAIGVLQDYIVGEFMSGTWEPLDIVRLCSVFVGVYEQWHARLMFLAADGRELRHVQAQQAWNTLWNSMHPALQYYWDNNGWAHEDIPSRYSNDSIPQLSHDESFKQDCDLAIQCLQRLQAMQMPGEIEIKHFSPTFPVELSRALELFTLPVPSISHSNADESSNKGLEDSATPAIPATPDVPEDAYTDSILYSTILRP